MIVVTQWSNLLICKTRKLSLSQQNLKNKMGNWAIFCPLIILTILVYTPGIQLAFGTRPLARPHFNIPRFMYYPIIFFYDEVRKIYVRKGIVKEKNVLKYKGWIARNTYY